LSNSAAGWRNKPVVTSLLVSSTTVSYSCSLHITCLACTIRKSYSFFDYGEGRFRPIRGVLRPEVTSPFDRRQCFLFRVSLTFSVYLAPFPRYKPFPLVEYGGMTISAARGRARLEMMSPFNYLIQHWHGWPLEFFVYFPPFKSYSISFDLHASEMFGEWIVPREIFFVVSLKRHLNHWVNPCRLGHEPSKSVEPFAYALCHLRNEENKLIKSQKYAYFTHVHASPHNFFHAASEIQAF
jgi:hypothetical protein